MAEPSAYIYLTETARGFFRSEIGRRVIEGPRGPDDGYGRVAARGHSVGESGWVTFYAVPTDEDGDAEKLTIRLPPHAVAAVAIPQKG